MLRKWAVITGADSGIGEEFAVQLYDMGYSILMISRSEDKLKTVKRKLERRSRQRKAPKRTDQEVQFIVKDLSDLTAVYSATDTIASVMKDGNVPAIFINSAGFGAVGEFTDLDISMQENMIDVDVKAPVLFTYRMIELMEKHGGGRILNVASSAGLFPGGPYMSVYYASKAFVVSFTNGVRRELTERHSPVKISSLCPGPVNTPFNVRAGVRNALRGISARTCVKAAIRGMKHDRAVIVPGVSIKAASAGAKVLPAGVIIPIVAHQQKRKM